MRVLIKLFSVSFLICSVLYVFSGVASAARAEDPSLTILLVGFDDSPSNTDVLALVSYDSASNSVRAIQLPRDTYVNYGDKKGKINGFYSYKKIKGETHTEALQSLSDKVSDLLGVKIDGSFAITTDGFVDLVDYLGGVSLDLESVPEPLRSGAVSESGKIRLDGEAALNFVRFRKGYIRADLERMDAQKLFAKALFNTIKSKREFFSLFKFISSNNEISFEIDKGHALAFAMQNVFKAASADFQITTLPGQAVKGQDTWYYIISRKESELLLEEYFPNSHKNFDEENNFIYEL